MENTPRGRLGAFDFRTDLNKGMGVFRLHDPLRQNVRIPAPVRRWRVEA